MDNPESYPEFVCRDEECDVFTCTPWQGGISVDMNAIASVNLTREDSKRLVRTIQDQLQEQELKGEVK